MSVPVTLVEPVGRAWHDEIVILDCADGFSAARDEVTGERLPSQVFHEGARDGFAGRRRLAVRLSLAPGQTRRLDLVSPAAEVSGNGGFSMRVVERGEVACHELANERLVVAIPASQPFNASERVPGPVLALRRARDEGWTGEGTWGPAKGCGRIETTFTDSGPLFARWSVCYHVGGREIARYEMTLLAGADFVQVREETALDAGAAFRFEMTGRDAPQYWCTHGGGEFVKVGSGSVAVPPPRKGLERPADFMHLDFHSGHFQVSYTWAGLWREGGPLVGVTELRGGRWRLPGRNRIRIRRCEGGLVWHFAAEGGSREYALVCGDPEPYAPAEGLSRFCHIRRKYGDVPLEKVRHWTLDWALPRRTAPLLYPAGTADRWREKAAAWPELVKGYQTLAAVTVDAALPGTLLPAYLLTGEKRLRDLLMGYMDGQLAAGVDHVLDNGYLRLIIFSGRAMKVALDAIDVLRATGDLEEAAEKTLARRLAFLAYCFADPDYWPWDAVCRQRGDGRSHGGEYWDDVGASICPPNFTTEYFSSTGIFALAYPEHPMAAAWTGWAEELFERTLRFRFFDSGSYIESANYHHHLQGMLVQLTLALLAAGRRDFFDHPRFKRNFDFFVQNLTPRIAYTQASLAEFSKPRHLSPPIDGRGVHVTNWGNSGHDCGGNEIPTALAVVAGVYADRDPAYARRLMTAWRRGNRTFCNAYWGFDLLALGRPELPEADLALGSRLLEGTGAVMRAAQGTQDEVLGWIKCGEATFHNCSDEGGLVLYARGAPLIGDFGYHVENEGRRESAFQTWKHACVTFGGRNTSFYLGVEQAQPPRSWRSTPEADMLVCDLPVEFILPAGAPYDQPVRVPRIEHTRSILFVKPHYFVIYDQIPQTSLPPTWWLHVLADRIDVEGNRALCRGRHGVDLDVQVLLPTPARLETGVYSVQRHIRVEQAGPGEFLAVLTPLRPGEAVPQAELGAAGGILKMVGSWGAHRIYIGGKDNPFIEWEMRDRPAGGRATGSSVSPSRR